MGVYTDSPDYAAAVLPNRHVRALTPVVETDSATRLPLYEFFHSDTDGAPMPRVGADTNTRGRAEAPAHWSLT